MEYGCNYILLCINKHSISPIQEKNLENSNK